jgi:hypothetical protein
MAVNAGETVQVVATMQDLVGSQIQNVHFWKHVDTASVTEAAVLSDILAEINVMYGEFQTWMPDTLEPVSLKMDIVEWFGGDKHIVRAVGEVPWTGWSGGTGTTDMAPQACAALANFDTPNVGAYARTFLGPVTEAAQKDGELVTAALADLASFGSQKISGVTVAGSFFTAAVMSTKYGQALALTASIAKSIIAYQRRRRAGRGS